MLYKRVNRTLQWWNNVLFTDEDNSKPSSSNGRAGILSRRWVIKLLFVEWDRLCGGSVIMQIIQDILQKSHGCLISSKNRHWTAVIDAYEGHFIYNSQQFKFISIQVSSTFKFIWKNITRTCSILVCILFDSFLHSLFFFCSPCIFSGNTNIFPYENSTLWIFPEV